MNKPDMITDDRSELAEKISQLLEKHAESLKASSVAYYDLNDSKWQTINKIFIVVTLLGVIALSLTIVQLWASIPTTLTVGVLEFILFMALVVQFFFMKTAFFNSKKRIRKIQTITNIRQETYTLKKIINRASSLYEHEKSRLDEFNSFYLEIKLSEAEVALRTAEGILEELDGK